MHVLVVYASSRGGTAGLARMVAEALLGHGITSEIGEANAVDDLEGYDAVIVGGALYNGRWHTDATWFVERNLAALRDTNVWFFSSGPLDHSARSGSLAPVQQVQELARRADIRGHMTFGGVLAKKPGGFLSSMLAWGKPGDYREPRQVIEWVGRIVAKMDEPKHGLLLPDAYASGSSLPTRVLRRLAAAGDDVDDNTEDLGLDVLAELAEG